jgi:hypothetical protein
VFATGPGEPGDPVVLVSTMTTRELVGGFGSEQAALSWLSSRHRDIRGRLAVPAVEHLPRVSLEEQLLAWLLRHPGEAGTVTAELPGPPWTADCRHEVHAALRTAVAAHGRQAGYPDVSAELGRRLLRAPRWAAAQVGWPAGDWAQQYLRRLAATYVTGPVMREAVRAITVEDQERMQAPAPGGVRQAGLPDQEARRQAAAHALQLPPPLARPDSVGARMRLAGPHP